MGKYKKFIEFSEAEKQDIIEKYYSGTPIAELAITKGTSIYHLRKIIPKAKQKRRWNTKLKEEDVNEIRSRIKNGEKMVDIAEYYSVSYSTISNISSRVTWNQDEKIDGRKIVRHAHRRENTVFLLMLLKMFFEGKRFTSTEVAAHLRCRQEAITNRLDLLIQAGFQIAKDEDKKYYLP